MNKYFPRLLDEQIKRRLNIYGAILLVGPKWCGKSTTAKKIAKSYIELQNPIQHDNYINTAKIRPDLLLQGEKPRLIDEWQEAPNLWDAIRYDVDNTGLKNQYILTGSVTPNDKKEEKPLHTGTGRIIRMLMRPMSLFETGDSTGEVSLNDLFNQKENITGIANKELEDIAFLCARGGWPAVIDISKNDATLIAQDYLDSLIHNDIKNVDGVDRNPTRLEAVIRSIARNSCTTASISTIKDDISYKNIEISEKTISNYITALERLYVIEDVLAWSPKLRSKTEIRTTPKRCFIDPSLAVAALRATDKDLLNDFNTFGFIFETLCLRDLRIYAQSLEGDVFFYRDKNGLESDAIIHLKDGRWGAIEIKLGSNDAIEEAAKNLKKLADIIDTNDMHNPSFLMIVTGEKYAYQREDGIYVVPITTLKN